MAGTSTKDQTEELRKAKIREAKGEPVMAEMPEELRRTKRNFLALASLMIFYNWSGASVKKLGAFGLEISVEDPQWIILQVFLVVGIYLTAQFGWQSYNYFMEIRVRITGAKDPSIASFGGAVFGAPTLYPIDSKQTSLHFWWANLTKSVPGLFEVNSSINTLKKSLEDAESPPQQINKAQQGALCNAINNLNKNLEPVKEILSDGDIQASISHYDNWVTHFSASQWLRYILLDLIIPTSIGLCAFYLTINAICI